MRGVSGGGWRREGGRWGGSGGRVGGEGVERGCLTEEEKEKRTGRGGRRLAEASIVVTDGTEQAAEFTE